LLFQLRFSLLHSYVGIVISNWHLAIRMKVADPDPYGSALFLEAGSGSVFALKPKFRSMLGSNIAVDGHGR
jgi:hypothetical protein